MKGAVKKVSSFFMGSPKNPNLERDHPSGLRLMLHRQVNHFLGFKKRIVEKSGNIILLSGGKGLKFFREIAAFEV